VGDYFYAIQLKASGIFRWGGKIERFDFEGGIIMCRKLLFLFVPTASSTQADMGVMVERAN